jgi:hypothetical protein
MTRSFAAVERFLERLLERPAARLFRTPVQPVHLQRQIERAMEAGRVSRSDRTYVPNRFRVLLHPADATLFDEERTLLQADLADAVLRRARVRGYRLVARPEVLLVPADGVGEGEVSVVADPLDPGLVRSAAAGLRTVDLEGPRPPRPPIPGTAPVPVATDAGVAPSSSAIAHAFGAAQANPVPAAFPAVLPAPDAMPPAAQPWAGEPPAGAACPGSDGAPSADVPWAPGPVLPDAGPDRLTVLIEIRSRNGQPWVFVFRGGMVRIGRGTDNEIVLPDDRVSRRHGQLTARQGTLVYTDLASSNGSQVNGAPVREIALAVGDVVRVGNSTLTIRPGI